MPRAAWDRWTCRSSPAWDSMRRARPPGARFAPTGRSTIRRHARARPRPRGAAPLRVDRDRRERGATAQVAEGKPAHHDRVLAVRARAGRDLRDLRRGLRLCSRRGESSRGESPRGESPRGEGRGAAARRGGMEECARGGAGTHQRTLVGEPGLVDRHAPPVQPEDPRAALGGRLVARASACGPAFEGYIRRDRFVLE